MTEQIEKFVFFDTETTGLFQKHWPTSSPANPRMLQISALLTDNTGKHLDAITYLIKPTWDKDKLHPKAFEAHGISYELAMEEGVDLGVALEGFSNLLRQCQGLVAFNNQYDLRIADIEYYHAKRNQAEFHSKQHFCAMQMSKPIVKCPPTDKMLARGMGHMYKPPKLQEAYVHFFGEEFKGAHDAREDVRATAAVFFKIWGQANKNSSCGFS